MVSIYKSYLFPSSFLHKANTKQRRNIPEWINPKAIKAKGSHQREYIIDMLSQSSGGPIAFRPSNLFIYLFIYFLTYLRKICEYPEQLMDEKHR